MRGGSGEDKGFGNTRQKVEVRSAKRKVGEVRKSEYGATIDDKEDIVQG